MAGMHRVLYLIVRAESEQDATETAQTTFENELKDNAKTTYDYCRVMESGHRVAGSDRWSAFEGEPIAAPLTDPQATEWLERGMEDTRRNFVGSLYRFLANAQQELADSVETAPEAFTELVEYARENPEKTRSEAADDLLDSQPRTLQALYDGGSRNHRYNAGCLREGNLMEAHVIDAYTYEGVTAADGSYRSENVHALLAEQPEDAWVVPVDAHY